MSRTTGRNLVWLILCLCVWASLARWRAHTVTVPIDSISGHGVSAPPWARRWLAPVSPRFYPSLGYVEPRLLDGLDAANVDGLRLGMSEAEAIATLKKRKRHVGHSDEPDTLLFHWGGAFLGRGRVHDIHSTMDGTLQAGSRQLRNHMSMAEVCAIWGQPYRIETFESSTDWTYRGKSTTLGLEFVEGRLLEFSWSSDSDRLSFHGCD